MPGAPLITKRYNALPNQGVALFNGFLYGQGINVANVTPSTSTATTPIITSTPVFTRRSMDALTTATPTATNDDNPFRDMHSSRKDWIIGLVILAFCFGMLCLFVAVDMRRKYKRGELQREVTGVLRGIFVLPPKGVYRGVCAVPAFLRSLPSRWRARQARKDFDKQMRALEASNEDEKKEKGVGNGVEQEEEVQGQGLPPLAAQNSRATAHDEYLRNFPEVPLENEPKRKIYEQILLNKMRKNGEGSRAQMPQ